MPFDEYRNYDALGLADLVRSGQVSAEELVETAIRRAETVNPKINAIVHPLYDMARQMASKAEPDAIFAGVPFLIKDLGLEVAETPRRSGSRRYAGYVSAQDSVVVQRLRKAGLVFLGKTNTPEFGLTPFTEPKWLGPTRNPWNLDFTAGGSSGGSAAAVAAGITPIASASDGGGSIRIPASCCAVFGLKPSRGRVSLGPQRGEAWSGASVEHCVSRSVRDSAALLDAIQGPSPGDPYFLPPPKSSYLSLSEREQDLGSLRIGYSVEHTLGKDVDAECVEAVENTARLLEDLKHRVEPAPLPYRAEDLVEVFVMMVGAEAGADLRALSRYLGRAAGARDVELASLVMALLGEWCTAAEAADAKRHWNDVARRMARFHERYDLLLTPTVPMAPFRIGALQPTRREKAIMWLTAVLKLKRLLKAKRGELADKIFSYVPWTPISNITGQPSMSVPLHWTDAGLPVGVMLTAPLGREDMLFRLAFQLEAAQPWWSRIPEDPF